MPTPLGRHGLLPDQPYPSYQSYLSAQPPEALRSALESTPEELLGEIERSGLRGRGGAGFPAATKWRTLAEHSCGRRFVVCNASEGEPGTFKDRALLRANPYSLLEGMLVAARVIGARELFIGIKARYRREIRRLQQAFREIRLSGLAGDVELVLVEGPDHYLFGEEKALLNVLEGGSPMPREAHYPPYEWGLQANAASPNPALVNNVETFSRVATIVRHGGESFAAIGSPDTPGPLLFTVCGDVRRPGVYELPSGTSLEELFHQVAGGPRPGRTLRAALSGVSNPVLPADRFLTPATFGDLQEAGGGLGSAGFLVLDDSRSLPRVAQSVARFLAVESCNQCTSCMVGLETASSKLDALLEDPGGAPGPLLDQALEAALSAPSQNRCYLPVQGSILVPSLVERFPEDFRPGAPGLDPELPRFPIFKIEDFDEEQGDFVYDESHARKQLDWSYVPEGMAV